MKTTFFTGKGDSGTSNTGKKSVAKDDVVFMLLGALDECNSWLGLTAVQAQTADILGVERAILLEMQQLLFVTQAEVASIAFEYGSYTDSPRKFPFIQPKHLVRCEEIIKQIDEEFPPLKKFIIPGGSIFSAQCDIARTIARKAERYAVLTSRKIELSPDLHAFLNRLSSVLFAVARIANFRQGIAENSPTY